MVRDYKRGNPVIRAVKQPPAMPGWSSPTSTRQVFRFTKIGSVRLYRKQCQGGAACRPVLNENLATLYSPGHACT